jgi:hypothetical protein
MRIYSGWDSDSLAFYMLFEARGEMSPFWL